MRRLDKFCSLCPSRLKATMAEVAASMTAKRRFGVFESRQGLFPPVRGLPSGAEMIANELGNVAPLDFMPDQILLPKLARTPATRRLCA
jgi:hypothetical protein